MGYACFCIFVPLGIKDLAWRFVSTTTHLRIINVVFTDYLQRYVVSIKVRFLPPAIRVSTQENHKGIHKITD